jgi:preprotein translocase subunit SecG
METVIIVIHLMVIVALIGVVLMQRSEGGALGIGGNANFLSSRGSGNMLTRSTAILAAAFFATSLSLTLLARFAERPSAIFNSVPTAGSPATPAGTTGSGQGILDQLQNLSKPPVGTAPATPGSPAVPAAPVTSGGAAVPVVPATPQVPTSQ